MDLRRLAACAVLASSAPLASAGGAPTATTCRAEEETLFSCPSRGKWIAVCASPSWTPDRGYVQYRFGPRTQAELAVPESRRATPKESVATATLPLSGGGIATATFEANGYAYVVYSGISGRWGLKSGVAVERAGQRVNVRRCDRGREGEFKGGLIDRPGLRAGARTFELPD